METTGKYYTPTIEEFHVGFEYIEVWNERCDENDTFKPAYKKEVFSKDDELELFEECLIPLEYDEEDGTWSEPVLVKYLDKEDIESLGFKICKDGSFIKNSVPRYCQWALNKYDDRKVSIKFYHPDDAEGELWFFGNIKNKSELKRLLKQLGIDE